MKITSREKSETRWGGERELSPPRYLAFLAWGDFHARSRFARSTIPEEKWGLLVVPSLQLFEKWIALSSGTARNQDKKVSRKTNINILLTVLKHHEEKRL